MATLRPLRLDDIPAQAELIAAVEAFDHTDEHYSVEDLVEEYANPDIEVGKDIVGAFEGDELVGYFAIYPRLVDGAPFKVHLEGAVRPSYRGQGVGTQLAAAMLARADAVHVERAPGAVARFVVLGLSDNVEQGSLFEAAGFTAERWTYAMRAQLAGLDLESDTPPRLPAGHTLLSYTPAHAAAVRDAHNVAFLDHPDFTPWTEVMWQQNVTGSRNFRPGLSVVVVPDADPSYVAAYVLSHEFDAHAAVTGRREAYVARVGTRRELRGQGVASVLLRESLRRYRAAGFDEASLSVDSENPTGALGVYERAGFVTERRWTNYAVERPALPGPATA